MRKGSFLDTDTHGPACNANVLIKCLYMSTIAQHNVFPGSDCFELFFLFFFKNGKIISQEKMYFKCDFFLDFQFYAFYKQAKEGECSESEPGFWDVVRKAKW